MALRSSAQPEPGRWLRCGRLARWLPRSLAGAVLSLGLVAALRVDPQLAFGSYFRPFFALVGGLVAIGIVRRAGELRAAVGLTDEALVLAWGRHRRSLPYARIRRLDFAPPFSGSRNWLPATALRDDAGRVWRISVFLDDGARLVEELLDRAGRHDLRAWSEVHRVLPAMRRRGLWLSAGYGIAAGILVLAVGYYWA